MDTGGAEGGGGGGGGGGGVILPSKYRVAEILAQMLFTYPLCTVYVGQVLFFVYFFSCLFAFCYLWRVRVGNSILYP